MATKKIAHVLTDEEQIAAIAKRIKRAQGQLGAVARMLEEGRNCEEIVTQMTAVSKAVNTALSENEFFDPANLEKMTKLLSYVLYLLLQRYFDSPPPIEYTSEEFLSVQ
jgi:DNA repair ATPase RecN